MSYILKKGAVGTGDATAANQQTQINQLAQIQTDCTSIYNNTLNIWETFKAKSNTQVLVFTSITAVGAAGLLQSFLANNNVYIQSVTSSQGAGTHDLFLICTDI